MTSTTRTPITQTLRISRDTQNENNVLKLGRYLSMYSLPFKNIYCETALVQKGID